MLLMDIPPTPPIVSSPPYECQLSGNCINWEDWLENNLFSGSFSSIGNGKVFLKSRESESATQFLGRAKYHIIILDDAPVAIELQDVHIQKSEKQQGVDAEKSITFIERLTPIREQLGLSITQLAELFGVTRKSIYDWYEGIEPRSNTVTRLEILTKALQDVPDGVDLKRLKVVWNIPVSGRSFREIYNDTDLEDGILLERLSATLKDLIPNMVKQNRLPRKPAAQVGKARLSELDKYVDFS